MALPNPDTDFPAWYQQVVKTAELADNSLARGTMVIRPYGYAIWEGIVSAVDRRLKITGHQNLYFPMLIPLSLLEKEAEHVEGFKPQVAIVTKAGGEELEEPLFVRPTSETVVWATYKDWIQSYRDLPLLYNQWANVVRWELRPRLFLRTTEFLWQEGHTAHETAEEAMRETLLILGDVYRAAFEEDMSIPVIQGRKSASERFPGAQETYSIEALMRDGKALQAGTSHYFGQRFSKAYNVRFQGRDGSLQYPFSTSWGISTRSIGGLIMCHGDAKGLRLPPALAPHQMVIVPIVDDTMKTRVLEAAAKIAASFPGVRVRLDDREQHRPGYKFAEWELKGVPLRLDLGARDLDAGRVELTRRDLGSKESCSLDSLTDAVPRLLDEIGANLLAQARARKQERSTEFSSLGEMKEFLSRGSGFAQSLWCGDEACEALIKMETTATIRSLSIEREDVDGKCVICSRPATEKAIWAQSY